MTTDMNILIDQSLRAPAWQDREAAKTALKAAGGAALPALEQALGDRDWKVRRHVAQLLDNALDNTNVHVLLRALKDANATVRRNSLHSLVCEDCKPEGCWTVDMTGTLLEVVRKDHSPRVRRAAIGYLNMRPAEQRILDALRGLHDHPHPKVRDRARCVYRAVERKLAAAATAAAVGAAGEAAPATA
jgi:HEAT repeat protein